MHFNVDSAARYEFLLRSCFSWRRNRDQAPPSRSLIHCTVEYSPWIDWGLTALSAQMGYIVPLKSMLQFKKSEIKEKADNVTCWEYTQ